MVAHHSDLPGDVMGQIADGGQMRVLHVDDEKGFADLVSVYLEREDKSLEVVTETAPEDALERLSDTDVDCVVSDYDMPGMNGLQFFERLREEHPSLPFILFTGKGSEEIASEAISAGVTDYLQKESGTDQYALLANRITNAVRQTHAEQKMEQGFKALETAREGISLLDEEGRFLYVNQAYADVYGYSQTELVGQHWELLYAEEHIDELYEEVLPAVPRDGRWQGEHTHITKSGDRVIVNHALAYANTGTMVCLIRDITEEKAVRRNLERERAQFELLVDAVEEYAIFSLDPDGHVISWNQGAERINGYETSEILGEHISTFYPEAKAEAGYSDELLLEALEENSVEDEGWWVRKDGSKFWADAVITAVRDEDGTHTGFVNVTRDTTERHKELEDAKESKAFVDRALEVLDDVFYVLDSDGNVSRIGDRAIEVTGYQEEEISAMDPVKLFAPDDREDVRADIEEALATGSARVEASVLTADGRTVPYEFRKQRMTDDDGRVVGVIGIGRDISEQKRQERRLRRQLDQFEQFGAVLSHDLRTPLTTAKGRLELAKETGDDEHLDRADAALDRLDELLTDLAEVMRQGTLVDELNAIELEPAVQAVWGPMATCEATLEVATDRRIRADEGAFARLVENVLKNALDHSGEDVTVTLGTLDDGFYFEDDGPGIPADEREAVFEPGYSEKGEDGTGLGLASVQQIAVAHGWEVTATESDNGGARFEFTGVTFAE